MTVDIKGRACRVGTLDGNVVTCPLHRATFDVTTGKNLSGINMSMPPDMMNKLSPEMIQMFQKSFEVVSEIEVQPLKTYKVDVKGDSIYVEDKPTHY